MYIKLWDDILDSTIWMEEDHVVRVFLTFLSWRTGMGSWTCRYRR